MPVYSGCEEDLFWLFIVEKIQKMVIKGRYLNTLGPFWYCNGESDTIKPTNIIRFDDARCISFSLDFQDGFADIPMEYHE